jgi:hypothetical protein
MSKKTKIILASLVVLLIAIAVFFAVKKFFPTSKPVQLNNTPTELSVPDAPEVRSMQGDETIKYLKETLPPEEVDKILNSSSNSPDVNTNPKN